MICTSRNNAVCAAILSVILVQVFCGDITNTRRINRNRGENATDVLASNAKSTTPWPSLGQRFTTNVSTNRRTSRPATQGPKKWIQQNNIWIRNEQAASNGKGTTVASSTSSKPPLNRGDTYTVLKPQVHDKNRQQALLDGLGGQQQNLSPISSTTSKTPAKPMSYAGAVKPQNSSPSPVPENVNIKAEPGEASDDELREFSEMLLKKDTNNAMKYVTLNLQGKTSSRLSSDEAPLPLLKIDSQAYKIPTIEKIILLYDNYFLDAGQNEVTSGQERIEENNLLDAMLPTPAMQYARNFLIQKGKLGKDPKEFRDLLRQIWFFTYSRGNGRIGSSGFEHVFVAEIKTNQVSGLHNWLYFNEEESNKRANYLGYLKQLDLGDKGAILKYHFTFHDIDKPVGSMFIGTSPELEMALYTTCFVLRADKICPLKMNGNRFIIRTYTFRYRGKNMIGSAFPEI